MNQDRLGLGTAALAALDDRKAVWKLLETALEEGITHFDTARLYGDGTMERTLAPFLRAYRKEITVTSKFGLAGRWSGSVPCVLVPKLRRFLKKLTGHRHCPSESIAASYTQPSPDLDIGRMRQSLRTSLRELGTDHIDIFLMHEARAEQIGPELLEALENEKQAGSIGSYGSGGEWANTMPLSNLNWPSRPVLQAPVSLALADNEPIHLSASPGIIHSVFRGMGHLEKKLAAQGGGADFPRGAFEAGMSLPALFLQWAMIRFPESRILIGARSTEVIKASAKNASASFCRESVLEQVEWLRSRSILSSIPL